MKFWMQPGSFRCLFCTEQLIPLSNLPPKKNSLPNLMTFAPEGLQINQSLVQTIHISIYLYIINIIKFTHIHIYIYIFIHIHIYLYVDKFN